MPTLAMRVLLKIVTLDTYNLCPGLMVCMEKFLSKYLKEGVYIERVVSKILRILLKFLTKYHSTSQRVRSTVQRDQSF